MAFKELSSVINNLSRLLGLRTSMLQNLVLAARKDSQSLKWFKKKLQIKSNKDMMMLFEEIIMEGQAEELESDEEVEIEDNAS